MSLTILQGDCLDRLKEMPPASVNCCVTSPPYWGLRDYGTAKWEGGDDSCDHEAQRKKRDAGSQPNINGNAGKVIRDGAGSVKWDCECGARRIDSQIGLEPTMDEYVAHLSAVFAEVWRVLRDDGTLWLNLGDTYSSGSRTTQVRDTFRDAASGKQDYLNGTAVRAATPEGLKPKDLIGVPWRVAFALQAAGWYLRSDIIWHKPNPMPESVTDRPTKAHEYIFLLSKSERYWYDAEAVKEAGVSPEMTKEEYAEALEKTSDAWYARVNVNIRENGAKQDNNLTAGRCPPGGRNKRTVWTVPTHPYSEAHFATFPPDLIRPCILAGCPVGGTVLDPFGGSGTTGMVALEYGRNAILIELNPEYAEMARQRCHVTPGLPLDFPPGRVAPGDDGKHGPPPMIKAGGSPAAELAL